MDLSVILIARRRERFFSLFGTSLDSAFLSSAFRRPPQRALPPCPDGNLE